MSFVAFEPVNSATLTVFVCFAKVKKERDLLSENFFAFSHHSFSVLFFLLLRALIRLGRIHNVSVPIILLPIIN
jgi:hypothetical protein